MEIDTHHVLARQVRPRRAEQAMGDPVLQLATQGVFVAAFALSLLDCLRRPSLPRLELALLFGCLTPIIAAQFAHQIFGNLPTIVSTAVAAVFVAHPFVLL